MVRLVLVACPDGHEEIAERFGVDERPPTLVGHRGAVETPHRCLDQAAPVQGEDVRVPSAEVLAELRRRGALHERGHVGDQRALVLGILARLNRRGVEASCASDLGGHVDLDVHHVEHAALRGGHVRDLCLRHAVVHLRHLRHAGKLRHDLGQHLGLRHFLLGLRIIVAGMVLVRVVSLLHAADDVGAHDARGPEHSLQGLHEDIVDLAVHDEGGGGHHAHEEHDQQHVLHGFEHFVMPEIEVQQHLVFLASHARDQAFLHEVPHHVGLPNHHLTLDDVLARDEGPPSAKLHDRREAVDPDRLVSDALVELAEAAHGPQEYVGLIRQRGRALQLLVRLLVRRLERLGPTPHGQVRLGVLADAEEGHQQHEHDGEQRHLRRQREHQAAREDPRFDLGAVGVSHHAASVEQGQALDDLRKAAHSSAHLRGPGGAEQHRVHARAAVGDFARRPKQVRQLEHHGHGAAHVHPEKDRPDVRPVDQQHDHHLIRENERYDRHEQIQDDDSWVVRHIHQRECAAPAERNGQGHDIDGHEPLLVDDGSQLVPQLPGERLGLHKVRDGHPRHVRRPPRRRRASRAPRHRLRSPVAPNRLPPGMPALGHRSAQLEHLPRSGLGGLGVPAPGARPGAYEACGRVHVPWRHLGAACGLGGT
mmetsp:Transcript_101051/g.309015  ORF Transcript_101051/g.309015 Transcript_101051/m.309015 type:complete len:649 (-) Transcript_101051:556-2502(-)